MTSISELATIRLRARSEWVEIVIEDSRHAPVARGFGSLEQQVERGVYRLAYRLGAVVERRLVAVEPGPPFVPDPPELLLPAAAPVDGTEAFAAEHAEAAARHSRELGRDTGLVLMMRATGGADAYVRPDHLADVWALGARVTWEPDATQRYAIWSSEGPSGGTTIRAPREKLPPDVLPVLEQPLYLCAGWQTLVFVPCGVGGPVFAEASIHLVPAGQVWDGGTFGALAVEALVGLLCAQARPPAPATIARIEEDTDGNPMAAILLAHLLRSQPGKADPALARLIARLRRLLPDHPDVRALAWLDPERGDARPHQVDWPPSLLAGYEAVELLDGDAPGVLPDGSAAVRREPQRVKEGLWTAWSMKPGEAPAGLSASELPGVEGVFTDPATRRVIAHLEREHEWSGGTDTQTLLEEPMSDITYATGLSSASVARALTDIASAVTEPEPPARPEPPPPLLPGADDELSAREARLGMLLRVLAVGFVLTIVPFVAVLDWGGAGSLAVVAIVVRGLLFAAVCTLAGSDVRRFGSLCQLVVATLAAEVVVILTVLVIRGLGEESVTLAFDIQPALAVAVWGAADLMLAVVIGYLWWRSYRERWGLRVLTPGNHRTLIALDEMMHGSERVVEPAGVARHIDDYLGAAPSRHRRTARQALFWISLLPLGRARAPFALLPRTIRDEIVAQVIARRSPFGLKAPHSVRVCHQLGALGYYSDPRAAKALEAPEGLAELPRSGTRPALRTLDARKLGAEELKFDAVVVGSGMTGALVAYRLAERGMRTLIVERGPYIDPTLASEEGLQTLPDLLDDGGLDLIRDSAMKVLEVQCLGGRSTAMATTWSSVIPAIAERWNDAHVEAGLDAQRFEAAWHRVQEWLPAGDHARAQLSNGAAAILRAIQTMYPVADAPRRPVPRDHRQARELSARSQAPLDTLLPWGQRRFGDDLQILPSCDAQRVLIRGKRPEAVECTLPTGRKLLVRAGTVVLAAGAIPTCQLLRRSDVSPRVGRRFSFDLATTLCADFAEWADPGNGAELLIAPDPHDQSYVLETLWQPLWLQAMTMPGLFEQHAENMARYQHMVTTRVHIGIDRTRGVHVPVRNRPRTAKLDAEEMEKLLRRVGTASKLLFASGARRVIPSTLSYREFRPEDALSDELAGSAWSPNEISVSVHPQGGAAMSHDPKHGVVDPDLRVHGHSNLYVCDASVFPVSVIRAPKLTAMALAEYAAERMG